MPRALRITIVIGACAAALAGVAFAALALERRTQARWTDDVSVRVSADLIEPRHVLWRSATPAPGALNSDADEYEPRIGPDGATMVMVRRRPGAGAELLASRWTPEGWTPPAPIAELNSDADELGPELSSDGRRLYFYSDRDGGLGGYDLWVAHAIDDGSARKWSAPINLGPAVNSASNEYGPALTPDGRTLFFSSDRPRPGEPRAGSAEPWTATLRERRARHDYDLFSAALDDGEARTATPVELLNTEHDEGAPAISPAGDFLWFASDRPGGRGGYDLYRTRLRDGAPTAVEALDEAINSADNELDPTLSADGFRVCFSSDRADGISSASADDSGGEVAPDYDLWCSVSREVYLEHPPGRSLADLLRLLWIDQWPWILALLLLAVLLALLARLLSNGAWRTRFARLSVLTQCLLISLLLHSVIAMLLTLWKVGSVLSDALGRSGAVQVALLSSGDGAEIAEQLRAAIDPLPESTAVSLGALAAPQVAESLARASMAPAPAERFELPASTPSPPAPPLQVLAAAPHALTVGAAVPPSGADPERTEEAALTSPSLMLPSPAPSPAPVPLFGATAAARPAGRAERVAPPVLAATSQPNAERRLELPKALESSMTLGGASEIESPPTPTPPLATQERIDEPQPAELELAALAGGEIRIPRAGASSADALGDQVVRTALPPASRALPALRARDAALALSESTAPPSAPVPPSVSETGEVGERASQLEAQPQPTAALIPAALSALPAPLSKPSDRPLSPGAPRSVATALPRSATQRAGAALAEQSQPPPIAAIAALAADAAELPPPLPEPAETFAQRDPEGRAEILEAMGGTAQTERAVALALEWFARHQADDGRWSSQHFEGAVSPHAASDGAHVEAREGARDGEARCDGAAEVKMDLATTSLALLCFLSAGQTHLDDGPHRERVAAAVRWISARQAPDGDLREDESGAKETMYGQTIAAVALCEAYAMTKDPALADAARRAASFVVKQAERSRRGDVSPEDTSVIGWQVMVLTSAKRAGLGAPDDAARAATDAARRWIDSVTVAPTAQGSTGSAGRFAYRRGEQASVAMTAEAMVVRQLLAELGGGDGAGEREALEASAQFVLQELPSWGTDAPTQTTARPTTHHLYYATMALFHQQGEPWRRWNEALAPELVRQQRRDGCAAGSWDPSDRWSKLGGRLYQTAICTLSLEVYYRYRPGDAGSSSHGR